MRGGERHARGLEPPSGLANDTGAMRVGAIPRADLAVYEIAVQTIGHRPKLAGDIFEFGPQAGFDIGGSGCVSAFVIADLPRPDSVFGDGGACRIEWQRSAADRCVKMCWHDRASFVEREHEVSLSRTFA